MAQYSVLPDGRLMWVEGYDLSNDESLLDILRTNAEIRGWFALAGQNGIRIGES